MTGWAGILFVAFRGGFLQISVAHHQSCTAVIWAQRFLYANTNHNDNYSH
jgi:hypothetical protein